MSVYGNVMGQRNGNREEEKEEKDVVEVREGVSGEMQGQADTNERDVEQRIHIQAQDLVLLRNRQRYEVAMHLQVPQQNRQTDEAGSFTATPLRVTRKGARRHNMVKRRTTRGKQMYRIKKCSFVAGRRKC